MLKEVVRHRVNDFLSQVDFVAFPSELFLELVDSLLLAINDLLHFEDLIYLHVSRSNDVCVFFRQRVDLTLKLLFLRIQSRCHLLFQALKLLILASNSLHESVSLTNYLVSHLNKIGDLTFKKCLRSFEVSLKLLQAHLVVPNFILFL